MEEVIWNTSRLRHNEKIPHQGAADFFPEWGPIDEEEQEAKAKERLTRKVQGIFGSLGGELPSGG